MNGCIQIVSAFLGSLGFGIVFRMKRRRLAFACLGGGVTWILYVLCEKYALSLFVSNFIATVFASAYAKVVAKHTKSPEIIYIITSVVPLIPGSSLYYALSSFIESSYDQFEQYAMTTGIVSAAISFGILLVTIFYNIIARTMIHIRGMELRNRNIEKNNGR